jgi:hypothetical protein
VEVNHILTTLSARHIALVVSTDLGASSLNNLTLHDSKGQALPITFKAPIALSGFLTRSAGPSVGTIYFVPIDSISGTYTNIATFEAQLVSGTLLYLTNGSGVKSNFSQWTIRAIAHTSVLSTYSHVDKLNGADDVSGVYTIPVNTYVGVTFDADSIYIYDYYISYPGSRTGISIGSSEKTFLTSAAVAPQDTVIVHKLYVDGIVQRDTIAFKTP